MTDPISLDARTARHAFPLLYPGQAQKEAFVNEALARIDALVQPAVAGRAVAPPAAPNPGEAYLVLAPGDAAWAGRGDSLAFWQGTHWLFQAPREGMSVFDSAHRAMLRYAAGAWKGASAIAAPAGGSTADAESRAAIAALIKALERVGILPG